MNSMVYLILLIAFIFTGCSSSPKTAPRTPDSATQICEPVRGNFAIGDPIRVIRTIQITNTRRTERDITISEAQNCRFTRIRMPSTSTSALTPEDHLTISRVSDTGGFIRAYHLRSSNDQRYLMSCSINDNMSESTIRGIFNDALESLGLEHLPDCAELNVVPASQQIPAGSDAPTPVEL